MNTPMAPVDQMVAPRREAVSTRLPSAARSVAVASALACSSVAIVVLLAWIAGLRAIAAFGQPWTPMVASTAIVVLAQGGAILWLVWDGARWRPQVLRGCAALIALLALPTLLNHYGLWTRGAFLFEPGAAWRMAPNTALAALLSAAAIALATGRAGGRRAAEALAGASLLTVAVMLVAFLFGANPLSDLMGRVNMSPVTGLSIAAANVGLLAAMPGGWVVTTLSDAGTGGRLARRLLPLAVLLPVLLTIVQIEAERTGAFGHEYGAAMRALATIVLLAIAILWSAHYINRREAERRRELALQTLLADAFALLGTSIELKPTLAAVAALCIPRLADRCSITLANDDGGLSRAPEDQKHAISLPLLARGREAGVLSLVRSESRDRYDDTDLRVAHQLADRCAMAIEQAHLFDEVQHELEQRQRAEGELRVLAAELEQRVERRTAELAVTNRELESFAYSVSHDLRTPLRALDGFSQALLEDYGPRLDETAREHLGRIRRASQRMAELIDAMLELSRVARVVMRREPVDLSEMARDVAAALREREPGRSVCTDIADSDTVTGDPRLLRVLLENLMGNAWKFTARREDARIEFARHPAPDSDRPVFVVRDNGAGFDMEYSNKLFGAFQRLHSDQDFAGTGVGLATAQRIVHRHGGEIRAEGAVGKGAAFYFTLS